MVLQAQSMTKQRLEIHKFPELVSKLKVSEINSGGQLLQTPKYTLPFLKSFFGLQNVNGAQHTYTHIYTYEKMFVRANV